MIPHQYITAGEVFDEIMVRLGDEYRGREEISFLSTLFAINDAMREVFLKTLPYKDWVYVSRIDIFDGKEMPYGFVKPIRVLLSSDGQPRSVTEARYASAKEFYSVTDSRASIIWNQQTIANPVFTLWGQPEVLGVTDNSKMSAYIYPQSYRGWMDCYILPTRADDVDDRLFIPFEFEDLVIMSALSRVYAMLGDNDKFGEVHTYVMSKITDLHKMLEEKKQTEKFEQGIFVTNEDGVPLEQGQLVSRGRR